MQSLQPFEGRGALVADRGFEPTVNEQLSKNASHYVLRAIKRLIKGAKLMNGGEWAETYRVMPQGSRYPRWSTAKTPYLREISEVLSDSDPAHRYVIVSKATQMGGSELALNEVLRRMHTDPCTVLYYMESKEKVEQWARERLNPALKRSPFDALSHSSQGNERRFPGGSIIMNGIGSGAAMSSVTARLVVGDEVGRYPKSISKEGDFLSLAKGRIKTFGAQGKVFLVSSPLTTERAEGSFQHYFELGDQREYHCKCAGCDEHYLWKVENLRTLDNGEVKMFCENCGYMTSDGGERFDAVREGKWVPHAKPQMVGAISYRINGLVAPSDWLPWQTVLADRALALSGKTSLQAFYNSTLGLPFDEPEARVPSASEVEKLMKAWDYRTGEVPNEASVLTLGIDVQKGWIDAEVKAWGPMLENWSIWRGQFERTPNDIEDCYRWISGIMSREFFNRERSHVGRVHLGCMDASFNQAFVLELTKRFPAPPSWDLRMRNAIPQGCLTPVKGASMLNAAQIIMGVPGGRSSKGAPRHLSYWRIGTDVAKWELYQALQFMKTGEEEFKDPISGEQRVLIGKPHAPVDYESDHFKELVVEQLLTKTHEETGEQIRYFYRPHRTPNEAIDLHVYNRMAAEILGLHTWEDWRWEDARNMMKADRGPPLSPEEVRERQRQRLAKARARVRGE